RRKIGFDDRARRDAPGGPLSNDRSHDQERLIMADSKGWIVTTSSDRPIAEITKDLKAAGFSVGHVLEEIGSITGQAADDTATKLRSIAGVVDVSPDAPVDIGPPGSPETW
ncbi:MAG: hypothetical protein ABUL68_05090, partial [Pseudomonadota bacterium]